MYTTILCSVARTIALNSLNKHAEDCDSKRTRKHRQIRSTNNTRHMYDAMDPTAKKTDVECDEYILSSLQPKKVAVKCVCVCSGHSHVFRRALRNEFGQLVSTRRGDEQWLQTKFRL